MPKPILTVGLSFGSDIKEVEENFKKNFKELTNEYHVLAYLTNTQDPVLKVFYEKDFNHVKYEELKKFIADAIKDIPIKERKNIPHT